MPYQWHGYSSSNQNHNASNAQVSNDPCNPMLVSPTRHSQLQQQQQQQQQYYIHPTAQNPIPSSSVRSEYKTESQELLQEEKQQQLILNPQPPTSGEITSVAQWQRAQML